MKTKTNKPTRLQAKILGRVERLIGNCHDVNPYLSGSDLWIAFNEGWQRELNEPLAGELRISGNCPSIRGRNGS